ncbi:uncharacterized protein [Bos indicus]|uniref:Uncharacterized protein isoform X2 n=1 Tax=Bos indicus TaxID=9915 RepID=A0ABM4QK02_BOSIN
MPPDHLVLKKETRMLGAVQVMIGLINGALGRIWLLFYTRQFEELSVEYKPIALLSGYPFWTFLFFIISGVLTIQTEKKRSPNSVLTLFRRAGLWEGENQQTVECEEQGRVIKKIPNGKVRFVTVYASTTTDASGTAEIPEQKEANLSESHTLRRHHRIPKEGGESEWTSLRSKPWQDQEGGTQLVKIPVTLGASRGHQSFPVSRPEVPWITIQGGNS